MISDERLRYILITGNTRGKDAQEMAKELLALRKAREGWKLVPVEPTDEMINAGDHFMDGLSRLGDAYEAMLAAAPTPTQ